jgi:hypothetical protein
VELRAHFVIHGMPKGWRDRRRPEGRRRRTRRRWRYVWSGISLSCGGARSRASPLCITFKIYIRMCNYNVAGQRFHLKINLPHSERAGGCPPALAIIAMSAQISCGCRTGSASS